MKMFMLLAILYNSNSMPPVVTPLKNAEACKEIGRLGERDKLIEPGWMCKEIIFMEVEDGYR